MVFEGFCIMTHNVSRLAQFYRELFETTSEGNDEHTTMNLVFPAIRCPVLLLQGDTRAGGVMTHAEIKQAWPLFLHPSHVRLDGVSHVLHNERKEPVVIALKTFFYPKQDETWDQSR